MLKGRDERLVAVVNSGEVNTVLLGKAFEICAHTYRDEVLVGGFDCLHHVALVSFQRTVFAGFDFEQVVVAGRAHLDAVAVTEVGLSGCDCDFVAAVGHPGVFIVVAGESGIPLLELSVFDANVLGRGDGFVLVGVEVVDGPVAKDVVDLVPVAGYEGFAQPAFLMVGYGSILHTERYESWIRKVVVAHRLVCGDCEVGRRLSGAGRSLRFRTQR